jgi:Type VI secretion system effector, Hcp
VAVDAFLQLVPYNSQPLTSDSQGGRRLQRPAPGTAADQGAGALFEIEDYSFDVEQTLNIGSQSTGAGAGKVTFNPFSVTRKIDKVSPTLFKMTCAGTP